MILWCSSWAPSTFVLLPSAAAFPAADDASARTKSSLLLLVPANHYHFLGGCYCYCEAQGWSQVAEFSYLQAIMHQMLRREELSYPEKGIGFRPWVHRYEVALWGMWVPLLMSHPFGKEWFRQTPRSHKDDSVGTHPRGTDSPLHSYWRARSGVGWQAWDAGLLPVGLAILLENHPHDCSSCCYQYYRKLRSNAHYESSSCYCGCVVAICIGISSPATSSHSHDLKLKTSRSATGGLRKAFSIRSPIPTRAEPGICREFALGELLNMHADP